MFIILLWKWCHFFTWSSNNLIIPSTTIISFGNKNIKPIRKLKHLADNILISDQSNTFKMIKPFFCILICVTTSKGQVISLIFFQGHFMESINYSHASDLPFLFPLPRLTSITEAQLLNNILITFLTGRKLHLVTS